MLCPNLHDRNIRSHIIIGREMDKINMAIHKEAGSRIALKGGGEFRVNMSLMTIGNSRGTMLRVLRQVSRFIELRAIPLQ